MFKIEKMDFLVALYVSCLVAAELMGAKIFPIIQTDWLRLNGSVGIFLIPIIYSINDIIVEVHGAERARGVVRIGIFIITLLLGFTLFAIALPAATRFAATEPAYDTIFAKSARITAASLIALMLADFLDIAIFSKIRQRLGKSKLWLRNNGSNFIAFFVDTVVFMTLAFYALDQSFADNAGFLVSLIIPYWLLKCSMSIIETPLVYAGVKWLKKKD
ncbi:MAG: queuosine precursor transporter [Weeksellaceae bacterium]